MDTMINVDDSELDYLNLKKGNMHLVDDTHSEFILYFLEKKKMIKQAGGSASNTSAGVVNLGGKAFFNGRVGKDQLGKDYKNIMSEHGVKCDLRKDDVKTGNVVALITKDGERTFATHLGSAVNFQKKDVNKKALLKSKILHIEGYMLENPAHKKACLYAMKIAKRKNIIVSADLADPSLIERNLSEFKKVVRKYVDILFLNEDEAKMFSGIKDEKQALIEVSKMVKLAIVKLGAEGSMMKIKNKILRFKAVKAKQVKDTNGAGDMYAAGVLYGIANGLSLEKSGKIGTYAATKIVEQRGARLDFKLEKDIKTLL